MDWTRAMRLAVAAVAVFAAPLQAQKAAPPASAAAVAARVDAYYNGLHSLKAHFVEMYHGPGVERSEAGTLTIARPGRMRWDYDAPPGKLFLVDGRDAWFYQPDAGEVQKIPVKKLDDLRSPLRFLLGRTHLAKELEGLGVSEAGGRLRLTGVPRFSAGQGPAQVTSLSLQVEPSGALDSLQSTSADGTEITITLTGQEPNASYAPDLFSFSPPPGVRVVEGAGVF